MAVSPCNPDGVFLMWWYDAYEDRETRHVYLFGKLLLPNPHHLEYPSVCLVIKHVQHHMYLVPKNNKTPMLKVYEEFRTLLGIRADLVVGKPTSKFLCFDTTHKGPKNLLEVWYPSNVPARRPKQGTTFGAVLQPNTSPLEYILLSLQLKGPRWLYVHGASEVKSGEGRLSHCRYEFSIKHSPADLDEKIVHAEAHDKIVPPLRLLTIYYEPDVHHNMSLGFNAAVRLDNLSRQPPDLEIQTVDCKQSDTLNWLCQYIQSHDVDIIVGHNFVGSKLTSLLRHMNSSVKNGLRTQMGRVIRPQEQAQRPPGRLWCDTQEYAKQVFPRDVDFALSTLNTKLGLSALDMKGMSDRAKCAHLVTLTTLLMHTLNIIPFAYHMSKVCQSTLSQSFATQRLIRVENLLLHEFHEAGHILPPVRDKYAKFKRDSGAYKGGLVLEPEIGFKDNLVLLLDFNSLYPSIIIEYKVCFSPQHIIPRVVQRLIQSRREVQAQMKMTKPGLAWDVLDIKQKAIKLVNNIMYGGLGARSSRFYNKALASLIAEKGREILAKTKLVIESLGYHSIYGDTDSIMIATLLKEESLDKAVQTGLHLVDVVNKEYKAVQLSLDGIFKSLLLLKKKKYAGLVVTDFKETPPRWHKEVKGIEVVRQDCCLMSKKILHKALDVILSAGDEEQIRDALRELKHNLKKNMVPAAEFVIHKKLSKPIAEYGNNNEPHVAVVRTQLARNVKQASHAGALVPYVILEGGPKGESLSTRAIHPSYLEILDLKRIPYKLDHDWYMQTQIIRPLERICAVVDICLEFKALPEKLYVPPPSLRFASHISEYRQIIDLPAFICDICHTPFVFRGVDLRCETEDCPGLVHEEKDVNTWTARICNTLTLQHRRLVSESYSKMRSSAQVYEWIESLLAMFDDSYKPMKQLERQVFEKARLHVEQMVAQSAYAHFNFNSLFTMK